MKLITRDTDYAIRALLCMAKSNKDRASVKELAGDLNIPRPFLRKILQVLTKKGMLKSYKGQGGGFALSREPVEIYLVDLIWIFQGQIRLNSCIFRKKICPRIKTCLLKKKIDKIERSVISQLKSITMESILE